MSAARSGNNTVVTIHFSDGTTMTITLTDFTGTLDPSSIVFAT